MLPLAQACGWERLIFLISEKNHFRRLLSSLGYRLLSQSFVFPKKSTRNDCWELRYGSNPGVVPLCRRCFQYPAYASPSLVRERIHAGAGTNPRGCECEYLRCESEYYTVRERIHAGAGANPRGCHLWLFILSSESRRKPKFLYTLLRVSATAAFPPTWVLGLGM